jgi:glycosyltransferase involved in cell wall biosynthesis
MIDLQAPGGMAVPQDDSGERSVNVIVPTFNRSHLVGRAIGSVLKQSYRPTKIIVIDDCSSDDTEEVIAAYSGTIPLTYARLERNGGGGAARNAGIAKANSDYVAFLDADDEWHHDHLLVLMKAAAHQSGHFAVAGSALRIGKTPRVLPGREFPQRGNVVEKLHFVLSAALAFQTSTLLMPQETARRFMFDPHLRRHQDWDLIFRMIESNVAMVLLADATTKYYTSDMGNISSTRSELPSLRFLAKHKDNMSAKSKARFVTLQIMRRRHKGFRMIVHLLYTMMLGGMGPKELVYYAREALLRDDFSRSALDTKGKNEVGKATAHQSSG